MNPPARPGHSLVGTALLYGAVWGLGEATLGHLLHLARVPGLPGLVMVPFAVAVMGRAAARSRSAAAVFLTGVVAAGFKFFDLLTPGTDILVIARPVQAILLEALAGAGWTAFMYSVIEGSFHKFEKIPFSGSAQDIAHRRKRTEVSGHPSPPRAGASGTSHEPTKGDVPVSR